MTFWIDAQLPPALAPWLSQHFKVAASNLNELGLRSAADGDIFQRARQPGIVIMTKDEDFVDLVTRLGIPPQILWVTCGNVTNRALRDLFTRTFAAAKDHLERGEPVVELTNS